MVLKILENLFQGKRVAIVGPAQYLMGKNFGKEIDGFDTIVRINRSYESVDIFPQDVGSRTDILYSCLIEKPANAGILDADKFHNLGIKFIIAPPASDLKGQASVTKLHDLIDIEKVKELSKKIPIRIVDHEFHSELARFVDCRPNTGFMAIYDILRFSPKLLKVYGFSFYLDGFVDGVKEGVQEEQNLTPQQFSDQCFNSKRHVQKNMWKFAKSTLLEDPRVEVDPVLHKILNLDSLDRDLFKNLNHE